MNPKFDEHGLLFIPYQGYTEGESGEQVEIGGVVDREMFSAIFGERTFEEALSMFPEGSSWHRSLVKLQQDGLI